MARQRSSSTPTAQAASGVQHLPVAPFLAPQPAQAPEVEVRLSTRRKKSAVAYFEHGKIVVVVPARLSVADRQELVDRLTRRMLKRRADGAASGDPALEARALLLADRYLDGVRPTSVRWVTNQRSRWASCTPGTGQIRISHRLKVVPEWVLDAVLVHELAHLVEPSHSAAFRALENRYPRRRDADVYLAGYLVGLGATPEPGWSLGGRGVGSEGCNGLDGHDGLDGLDGLDGDLEAELDPRCAGAGARSDPGPAPDQLGGPGGDSLRGLFA